MIFKFINIFRKAKSEKYRIHFLKEHLILNKIVQAVCYNYKKTLVQI